MCGKRPIADPAALGSAAGASHVPCAVTKAFYSARPALLQAREGQRCISWYRWRRSIPRPWRRWIPASPPPAPPPRKQGDKMKLTEGTKYDTNKPRYDLLDAYALHQIVLVYTFGAAKYEDDNWSKGISWKRVFAASMRHLWSFWRGEEIDSESGLPHLAHAAWNIITLLNYSKYRREFDDRPKYDEMEAKNDTR